MRAALKAEWDSGVRPSASIPEGLTSLQVEAVGRRDFEQYIGMSIEEISEAENKHPIDALLDIILGDNLGTEFFGPSARYNAENTAEIGTHPTPSPGHRTGGPREVQPWGSLSHGHPDLAG